MIPRLDELARVGDDLSSCSVDHPSYSWRSEFVGIAEIFLEFIRIIRSIIEMSIEFATPRIHIPSSI
jgi:hypothetical protein